MNFGDESHHEERRHHKKSYPVPLEPEEWSNTSLHLSDDCQFWDWRRETKHTMASSSNGVDGVLGGWP
jgi:hypothetical protein